VRGRYGLRYCGAGDVRRCAAVLWAGIDAGARTAAATQGPDPAAWRRPAVRFDFTPLPLLEMQWTNRPSGIHQVLQFDP
jgi:hypothetical protein